MTKETSKCYQMRSERGYFDKYLVGDGIDIGCGDDPLAVPNGVVFCYDKKQGDAQDVKNVDDDTYDFVYSSHCLEHLENPYQALNNWIRICKPGGHLYIIVPDEDLYEQKKWPSKWNKEHKWSFSLNKSTRMPKNIVFSDFLSSFSRVEVLEIFQNHQNYDFTLLGSNPIIDQTFDASKMVCAQIEAILQKKS